MAATFYNPLVISVGVAEGSPQTFTAMRPIAVVDALASVTVAVPAVAGTVQVSSTAGNVTNSIALGTNVPNNVGRATTILSTNGKIAVGGTLTFTGGGAGTASRVSVIAVAN